MSSQKKPAALLPADREHDGPLFFVITIIVFLASLAALSGVLAMQNVSHWQQALKSEITVQIKSGNQSEARRAVGRLNEMQGIYSARLASREEAKALLEPWLGADNIPDDLPLPLLIYLKLEPGDPPGARELDAALAGFGIDASIDDHQRWAKGLARSARAVQIVSIAVLSLLVTASIAITGFATRAALAARRDLVGVLHLVGARDRVIARLFGKRFIGLGLKAGATGTVLAALALGILWLGRFGDNQLGFTAIHPSFSHLLILLPIPLLTALVGGWTAHRSVLASLRKRR